MANRKKSYFLAPTFELAPGSVELGSLIKDKERPDIPFIKPIPTPREATNKSASYKYKHSFKTKAHYGFGIFAEFVRAIISIGFKINVFTEKLEEVFIECDKIETQSFVPTTDYLRECFNEDIVYDHVTSSWFGRTRKLYMVTGIKTVENARITTSTENGLGVQLSFQADGTLVGIPQGLGPEADFVTEKAESASRVSTEPIIFAYRISEVVRRPTGKISAKDVTDGTLLGDQAPDEDLTDEFELQSYGEGNGFDDIGEELEEVGLPGGGLQKAN